MTIAEARDPSPGISFHPIEEYNVQPPPEDEYSGELDTIRHYGIVVDHEEEIRKLTVKYTYFGLPFEKEIKRIEG
ncbi:hypothetical protein EQV77_13590 [Halobacillus fulvus]|nr:hypothetical protein EQV77_13590 [Halobacillus fulvus]